VREQVIAQKVGGRAGLSGSRSGANAQRPVRRNGRSPSAATLGERLRSAAPRLSLIGKMVLAIAAGAMIFAGYRAAASASFFQVRNIEVRGTARASTEEVQQVVRREVGPRGVWRADLTVVSAQLEHLPWVRTAVVTRLLPDGIRVRITERVARAVVRTAPGRFVWVDDDAVVLGEMSPADQMPTFFLRGWSEDNSEGARLDNRERVQKYLELTRAWDAAGLSERVSEVNLIDVRDIRAQLAGDDSQIEVRLGPKDPGTRLKKALEVLDGLRQTPRGALINYVDLTQGKRAIVGFTSGKQISSESAQTGAATEDDASTTKPDGTNTRVAKPEPETNDKRGTDIRKAKETSVRNQNRVRAN
jgi:cell division septal protein FtsQ